MGASKATENIILITRMFHFKKTATQMVVIIYNIGDDLIDKRLHGHVLSHQVHFPDFINSQRLEVHEANKGSSALKTQGSTANQKLRQSQ